MKILRADRRRIAAIALLTFVLCAGAGASVFKVLGRNWSGWVPMANLPWEKAYVSNMVVNGKRVEMYVFTARYTEPVADQLNAVLTSIGAVTKPGTASLSGVAQLNDYEVKYVISSPPSDPRHYIFLSYTDPGGPVRQKFPLPLYPNGNVLSTVSDLDNGSDYVSIHTPDTPTEVHEYYRGLLTADGWSQTKPCHVDSGESTGLAIYSKKGQICFIDIVRGKNISSTVSVLVEKGK